MRRLTGFGRRAYSARWAHTHTHKGRFTGLQVTGGGIALWSCQVLSLLWPQAETTGLSTSNLGGIIVCVMAYGRKKNDLGHESWP